MYAAEDFFSFHLSHYLISSHIGVKTKISHLIFQWDMYELYTVALIQSLI